DRDAFDGPEIDHEIGRRRAVDEAQPDFRSFFDGEHLGGGQRALVGGEGAVVISLRSGFELCMPPPAIAIGLGLRKASSSCVGGVQEKSSNRTTISCRPLLMASVSRMISGAANRSCSCKPKCECIQRVPGG